MSVTLVQAYRTTVFPHARVVDALAWRRNPAVSAHHRAKVLTQPLRCLCRSRRCRARRRMCSCSTWRCASQKDIIRRWQLQCQTRPGIVATLSRSSIARRGRLQWHSLLGYDARFLDILHLGDLERATASRVEFPAKECRNFRFVPFHAQRIQCRAVCVPSSAVYQIRVVVFRNSIYGFTLFNFGRCYSPIEFVYLPKILRRSSKGPILKRSPLVWSHLGDVLFLRYA